MKPPILSMHMHVLGPPDVCALCSCKVDRITALTAYQPHGSTCIYPYVICAECTKRAQRNPRVLELVERRIDAWRARQTIFAAPEPGGAA